MSEKEISSIMEEISNATMDRMEHQEEVAAYFVEVRGCFDQLNQVIQSISGCLILYKSATRVSDQIGKSLMMAGRWLAETTEQLKTIDVPQKVQEHYYNLVRTANSLRAILPESDLDHVLAMTLQHPQVLSYLEIARIHLKKASSIPLGLERVTLDASCANHSHP